MIESNMAAALLWYEHADDAHERLPGCGEVIDEIGELIGVAADGLASFSGRGTGGLLVQHPQRLLAPLLYPCAVCFQPVGQLVFDLSATDVDVVTGGLNSLGRKGLDGFD